MKKTEIGVWLKGEFCPLWSGVYTQMSNNPSFIRGGLPGLSRAIKVVVQDAGVVVWYED